jgi:hypothetical protein
LGKDLKVERLKSSTVERCKVLIAKFSELFYFYSFALFASPTGL